MSMNNCFKVNYYAINIEIYYYLELVFVFEMITVSLVTN